MCKYKHPETKKPIFSEDSIRKNLYHLIAQISTTAKQNASQKKILWGQIKSVFGFESE